MISWITKKTIDYRLGVERNEIDHLLDLNKREMLILIRNLINESEARKLEHFAALSSQVRGFSGEIKRLEGELEHTKKQIIEEWNRNRK